METELSRPSSAGRHTATMTMPLTEEQRAAIDAAIVNGKIIDAVRNHRAFTGSDLGTAKHFVDLRLSELLESGPQRFPAPPISIHPESAIVDRIFVSPNRELLSVNRLLTQMEKTLYGLNYQVTLSARMAELPAEAPSPVEMMAALYPESQPTTAKFDSVTVDQFKTEIASRLTDEGDDGSGPQFSHKRRSRLINELIPSYWCQLDALTPLNDSALHSYNCEVGLPGYYVFWLYAYLIHCQTNNRCLVVTGMSSD